MIRSPGSCTRTLGRSCPWIGWERGVTGAINGAGSRGAEEQGAEEQGEEELEALDLSESEAILRGWSSARVALCADKN
jgi:hypothetical protein